MRPVSGVIDARSAVAILVVKRVSETNWNGVNVPGLPSQLVAVHLCQVAQLEPAD